MNPNSVNSRAVSETRQHRRRSFGVRGYLYLCSLLWWGLILPSVKAEVVSPPNYKALIIGINDYADNSSTGWIDLKAAEKDTDELYQLLIDKYGFQKEQVTYLPGRKASKDNILDAVDELLGKATEQDSVLIYYAGHGAVRNGVYYWVPADGNRQVHKTGVPTATIELQVNASKARHVLLVADSCLRATWVYRAGKAYRTLFLPFRRLIIGDSWTVSPIRCWYQAIEPPCWMRQPRAIPERSSSTVIRPLPRSSWGD